LLVRRGMAFLDDGLEALFEGVTGLQRRCDRDQEVRQLVLESLQPLSHLEPDNAERDHSDRHADGDEDDGPRPEEKCEQCREDPGAERDPDELDRSELDVGTFEHFADRPPLLQMAESLLGGGEDRRESLAAPLLAILLRVLALALTGVGDDAATNPRTADAGQEEETPEEHEQRDGDGDRKRAAGAVRVLRKELRRGGGRRRVTRRDLGKLRGRALADDRRGEPDAVSGPRGRDVLDSPCLLQCRGDRRIDTCEIRRRSSSVVLAPRRPRELLEWVGGESLA